LYLKEGGNTLRIFERRILRMTFGPVKDNVIWRTRCHSELYSIHSEPDKADGQNRKTEMVGTPL